MDCWMAANLPRLAVHSLSMASKARVTNPPAAPATALARPQISPPVAERVGNGLDPRRGSGHGARDLERGKPGRRAETATTLSSSSAWPRGAPWRA
ncbi:hypothetical protein GUJ93_ZPchr0006g42347 [Zizania palustris]|uniref:Uncharacterized protein n=1 Tax=Zizania palustris TaxID=103762 RepID=A0A8J5VI09_ZIZPA|nr:hypothetical protein GUJ93_ZPchr0006g42347 [Zizania palustris]